MAATLAEVKEEWRHFRDDSPGERFRNHRERMQKKSRKHAAVALALGVLLLVGGIVLLFFPGPGTPLIIFGLALIASHSEKLSNVLDRTEPRVRERGHELERWWEALSRMQRASIIVIAVAIATAGLMAIWKWVVAAYVL